MRRRPRLRTFQNGMTVLEVVVSLVIAGAFLSVMLPATVQAYARFKHAELQNRAGELATAKAEELAQVTARDSFPREGLENGLRWRVDMARMQGQDGLAADGRAALRIYTISVFRDKNDPLVSIDVHRLFAER